MAFWFLDGMQFIVHSVFLCTHIEMSDDTVLLEVCTSNSLCGSCNYIRSLHSATVLFRTPEVVVSVAFNFQQLDTKDNCDPLSQNDRLVAFWHYRDIYSERRENADYRGEKMIVVSAKIKKLWRVKSQWG